MTLLAVPLLVHDLDTALAQAARAAEHGADFVEYRIDTFDDAAAIKQLIARSPLPCLVTCRPTWEGGHYDGDEMHRLSLLENALIGAADGLAPAAYLDVELKAYQSSANLRQKVGLMVAHPSQPRSHLTTALILSSHDFATMPADLDRRVLAMAEAPACRVVKVAWRARSLRDNLEAFALLQRRVKPTVALCMGEAGLPSRVLAKKFGALLTFAALDSSGGTAPGQPTLDEIKRLYRWDHLDADTQVFGVIGHPVGHSRSPALHNAGFDAIHFNGVYLPMPIPPEYEHFKATVLSWLDFEGLHFRGASVTIPHKQNLLRFVEEQGGEVEPLAARIGAANTLTKRDDASGGGTLYASNTDYAAILDAVCGKLTINRDGLKGMRVAVLGAGGAARAAVAALTHYRGVVTVFNRTPAKARTLAEAFGASAAALDALDPFAFDLLLNCTPVGMHPHIDATPLDLRAIKNPHSKIKNPLVFDTIYNPAQTRLLRDAEALGLPTISGVEMFVRQAATQFELWTQQPAPLDVFRAVLRSSLK